MPRSDSTRRLDVAELRVYGYSNAKIFFQSFFMLMTVHPFFFASSYSAWLKLPILVGGSPCA